MVDMQMEAIKFKKDRMACTISCPHKKGDMDGAFMVGSFGCVVMCGYCKGLDLKKQTILCSCRLEETLKELKNENVQDLLMRLELEIISKITKEEQVIK